MKIVFSVRRTVFHVLTVQMWKLKILHCFSQFFDTANEHVTDVQSGEVKIAGKFIENNNLRVGDYIRIKMGDVQMDLKIAGKVKDAFLGAAIFIPPREIAAATANTKNRIFFMRNIIPKESSSILRSM